jgi:hypothetical protein
MSRGLRAAVALLVIVGVAAATMRALHVGDLGRIADPLREMAFARMGLVDAHPATRAAAVEETDRRFATYRAATLLHVIPGGLFLLLAPLQFSRRIRDRFLGVHRWVGRCLLTLALIAGLSGMFFGVLIPFAGESERIVIAVFGTLFLVAVVRGYFAIRAGDTARHRAWMIRAFAVAAGVSTVRLVSAVLDPLMATRGYDVRTIFVASLWVGWVITMAVAEWWIRRQPLTPPAMIPAM